jgi:hypothetical protein
MLTQKISPGLILIVPKEYNLGQQMVKETSFFSLGVKPLIHQSIDQH